MCSVLSKVGSEARIMDSSFKEESKELNNTMSSNGESHDRDYIPISSSVDHY